jgi:predicted 3-demethylubiquinone-9 3-methyltransferase (glyoxalase superfamily)
LIEALLPIRQELALKVAAHCGSTEFSHRLAPKRSLSFKRKVSMFGITPCLWFDGNAEEAAKFYASLFPDSNIDAVHRAPSDYPSGKAGDVLLVEFTLMGQPFTGLNGGPQFQFNEAISFQIPVETQAEADRFADALSAVPEAEQCGWVKDRFGVSWQIVPSQLIRLIGDADGARARRAFEAMMQMKRIDIAALERAADAIAPSA